MNQLSKVEFYRFSTIRAPVRFGTLYKPQEAGEVFKIVLKSNENFTIFDNFDRKFAGFFKIFQRFIKYLAIIWEKVRKN